MLRLVCGESPLEKGRGKGKVEKEKKGPGGFTST